jgi:hypothetical protein
MARTGEKAQPPRPADQKNEKQLAAGDDSDRTSGGNI